LGLSPQGDEAVNVFQNIVKKADVYIGVNAPNPNGAI
jgi:hypothetical protein